MRTMTDFLALARQYAARPDDWPVAPRFNPVQRWYYRIAEEPGYEVWLLTWLPGQHTELHDHGGSAGGFVVVQGTLTEQTIGGGRVFTRTLLAGEGRRFGSHHVHGIANAARTPAVSLHVYGPALRTMTRYRLEGNELRTLAVDTAGAQW